MTTQTIFQVLSHSTASQVFILEMKIHIYLHTKFELFNLGGGPHVDILESSFSKCECISDPSHYINPPIVPLKNCCTEPT